MLSGLSKHIFKVRQAYRMVFGQGPATDIVLSDLAKFCRARTTPAVVSMVTNQVDPIATGIAIGRLEVWHRITQNIHLSDSDLYRLVEAQRNQGEEDA